MTGQNLPENPGVPPPPKWGDDSLSYILEAAHRNIFHTFHNKNKAFELLRNVHESFRCVLDYKENIVNFSDLFLPRSHAAYLAAVRLALCGQQPESHMCLRGCLENSLYGFIVHVEDPEGETFLGKIDDVQSRKKFIRQMRPSNILEVLKRKSPEKAKLASQLYDCTIECGAHPNPLGILTGLSFQKEKKGTSITTNYFNDASEVFDLCLLICFRVGACALEIFSLVYPEVFEVTGLTDELDKLRAGLNIQA